MTSLFRVQTAEEKTAYQRNFGNFVQKVAFTTQYVQHTISGLGDYRAI
jgi:hypothetical protein